MCGIDSNRIREYNLAKARNILLVSVGLFCLWFATMPASAQTFTVLHTFTGKGDGRLPFAGVIQDGSGNLFGTTYYGGAFDDGVVFQIKPNGKEKILHSFWGGDGWVPEAPVLRTSTGILYGTTSYGGKPKGGGCHHGCGEVFRLDTSGKLTVLYAFPGGENGGQLWTGIVEDKQGYLYGTTEQGGDAGCDYGWGCGVVFKLDRSGKETVLHAFTNQPDGWSPSGELILDSAGNLYGVTEAGGTSENGTVFKVTPSGEETVLFSFPGGTGGYAPQGPLLPDAVGNFYGVTAVGGGYGCGTVFKLDGAGNETILYNFAGTTDGCQPQGGLIWDAKGNLYGATRVGGNGGGTIYRLDTGGNITVLYSFTGGSDGNEPWGSLVLDKSGTLYGATEGGGNMSCGTNFGCGVVFKLTP